MRRLLIRHAAGQEYDPYAVGARALNEEGTRQALELKEALLKMDIDPSTKTAATSTALRAKHTARMSGFAVVEPYPQLNQVVAPPDETDRLLAKGRVPDAALEAARIVLQFPPREELIITHSLVIMGLQERLGLVQPGEHIVPYYGAIVPVEF